MVKFGLFWSLKVAGTENREISKMDYGNSHMTVRSDFYVSSRITEFSSTTPVTSGGVGFPPYSHDRT